MEKLHRAKAVFSMPWKAKKTQVGVVAEAAVGTAATVHALAPQIVAGAPARVFGYPQ
jgi:hypothetical protein